MISPPVLLTLFAGLFSVSSLIAETWNFTAERLTSVQRNTGSRTVLEGGARAFSDNLIIRAESLELAGPDYDWISGSGEISLTDREKGITVESARFEYDREKKLIRFRGAVSLVDEDEGILIRAESMDFFEEEDFVVMQVAVRLIKEDAIGRGEFATFRREENLLKLSGQPVVWKDRSTYRADRITVNLDTDEIVLEGTVQGRLISDEDE